MSWLLLLSLVAAVFAAAVYLWREQMGSEGIALAALRTAALIALLVALFNPVSTSQGAGLPPTVLLDASLSMDAEGADWARARDTAFALAGSNGTVMMFGRAVRPADSTPPVDGASRLADALRVAAGRSGPVFVVTDGEIDDRATIPPVLLDGVGVVPMPRDPIPDVALLDVAVRDRYLDTDTVRANLTIGRWNIDGAIDVGLDVYLDERRLLTETIDVPANAPSVRRSVALSPGSVPDGSHLLRFVLTHSADGEPRTNERQRVVTITSQPGVVVIVDPADAEGRFLVRELASVVNRGVRGYARITDDTWVDMADLTPVGDAFVRQRARDASLVVVRGPRTDTYGGRAVWHWPTADGRTEFFEGDWYVTPEIGPSPLAGRFAAVTWDSVPPLTGIIPVVTSNAQFVALSGRLGRRGADRPLLIGQDSSRMRRLTTTSSGLWRWALRGGAALEAYRAAVSAGVDWLLEDDGGSRRSPLAADRSAPRGRPIVFRWLDPAPPESTVAVQLSGPDSAWAQDLAFDAGGEVRMFLDPGAYQWSAPNIPDASGMFVVETYSDEYRPRRVTVGAASTGNAFQQVFRYARERWWLFVLAMAALIGEWAWRQRRGLP